MWELAGSPNSRCQNFATFETAARLNPFRTAQSCMVPSWFVTARSAAYASPANSSFTFDPALRKTPQTRTITLHFASVTRRSTRSSMKQKSPAPATTSAPHAPRGSKDHHQSRKPSRRVSGKRSLRRVAHHAQRLPPAQKSMEILQIRSRHFSHQRPIRRRKRPLSLLVSQQIIQLLPSHMFEVFRLIAH